MTTQTEILKKTKALENLINLPIYKNFFEGLTPKISTGEKNGNIVVAFNATSGTEKFCQKNLVFTLLKKYDRPNTDIVFVSSKFFMKADYSYQKDFQFNNLAFLKFERKNGIVLMTEFAYSNGLDGKPIFKPTFNSNCFFADKKNQLPFGIQFEKFGNYVFPIEVKGFDTATYLKDNSCDIHKDKFWKDCQK